MVGTARAASSLRNLALLQQRDEVRRGRVRRRHRRPRPRGAVQRRRCCGGPSSSSGSSGRGAGSRVAGGRAQGRLDAALPPLRGHRQWAGFADKPGYHDAQAIGHKLAELYEAEEVDRVVLIYNRFESALVQRVTTTDLLPIREEVLGGRGGGARGPERRLHLRAGAGADPPAAPARLSRDGDLPRAARVGGRLPRLADDRDAERVEERRRADRQPHALAEPRAPGRDHAGDPRGRRRRGRAHRVSQGPRDAQHSVSVASGVRMLAQPRVR